ncbi:hypothetical protein [Tepidibacillus sp. LV47]|uniref:hypothetical protein n=1 Tax=Tepidibacillus sp. LV47 TaxID=3398228 RepID=UPI003AADE40B
MRLKNWLLTFVVFIISLIVLFGGSFLYQDFRIEKPIKEAINEIKGVKLQQIQLDKEKVILTLDVSNIDNFVNTYHQIEERVVPIIGKRELQLHFESNQDQALLHAWNQAYFDVAQAIDKNEYSTIPTVVKKIKSQAHLDKVGYGMDEKSVYIDLHAGDKSLYVILPRKDDQVVKNHG